MDNLNLYNRIFQLLTELNKIKIIDQIDNPIVELEIIKELVSYMNNLHLYHNQTIYAGILYPLDPTTYKNDSILINYIIDNLNYFKECYEPDRYYINFLDINNKYYDYFDDKSTALKIYHISGKIFTYNKIENGLVYDTSDNYYDLFDCVIATNLQLRKYKINKLLNE